MGETLKPILLRQMGFYARVLEHTDHHVGQMIDPIEAVGALEQTLIFYIIGVDRASAEGTLRGLSTS